MSRKKKGGLAGLATEDAMEKPQGSTVVVATLRANGRSFEAIHVDEGIDRRKIGPGEVMGQEERL
jgi:hypothetical protein